MPCVQASQNYMNWRDYNPVELEREYTPASRVENIQIYLDQYATAGAHSRHVVRHDKLQYGPHADEWLWLAPSTNAENQTKNLVVFVHGGFWRRLSADDGTFLTPAWHQQGYDFVSVNYSLCPNEPLETLVDQTLKAIQFLHTSYCPSNITLVGHSAGAQLVAMALNSIAAKFERAILVSGIFDLEPITNTSINDSTRLDAESSYHLSPINFVSQAKDTPLVIIWGENETDEFKRQSRDFESAWNKTDEHTPCIAREISKRNHFDILYDLTTPIVIGLFNE